MIALEEIQTAGSVQDQRLPHRLSVDLQGHLEQEDLCLTMRYLQKSSSIDSLAVVAWAALSVRLDPLRTCNLI